MLTSESKICNDVQWIQPAEKKLLKWMKACSQRDQISQKGVKLMMYSLNDRNHGVLRNETTNHQNGHDSLVKQVLIINFVKKRIGVGVEEYGRNKKKIIVK